MENVRFFDPRKDPGQQFELYFRKDLPRLVTKCQGQCSKSIKPDDDNLLVRTYGTSSWTDQKTGASKSNMLKYKCIKLKMSRNF